MATSGGAGGGSLRLMSCVRETSPLDIVDAEEPRHEPKKRRFHPFRGLRRMFRRKSRTPEVEPSSNPDAQSLEARSQSASQLLEDNKTGRRSGGNLQSSGLSVSHDSVFSPEQQSADSASELESTSSLSIQRLILAQSGIRAELVDAVRRRRSRGDQSDEEEDLGLPRSPCSNSPTTADVLFEKFPKETTNKSSHSTCSDGSLLSMGSSEMDEDSYGQSSRHSSKLSLQDKRNLVNSEISPTHGAPQLELGVGEVITTPLSHSAARHKMAVKPKRTHGAPRRRRMHAIGSLVAASSLPVTPEVNEDGSNSGRSVTPDIESNNVSKGSGDAVAVTTSVCISSITTNTITTTPSSTLLKSSSLPPGLAPPSLNQWNEPSSTPVKLSRSRSSATNRQLDPSSATESSSSISENDELDVDKHKKEDMSFFSRLLSRRSGKKKKGTDEKDLNETPLELPQKRMDEKGRYVHEMSKLNRNHPASRQRVEPINIPSECPTAVTRMHVSYSAPTPPLSPKSLKNDNDLLFKQPNNKVIPLSSNDLIHQRKSLLKKSNSFRSDNESDSNTQMFMSLDTKNTAINLQTNEKSDEFINTIGNNDDAGDKIQEEEVINSIVNDNNSVGALNKNLVQDVTNSNLVLSTNESNDFTITTKSMIVNDTDVHNKISSVSVNVKTPLVDDTNSCNEQVNNDVTHVKNRVRNHSLNLDENNEDTIDNTSHQITIPVGTSIVNIINESPNVDNDKISEIMNVKTTSPTSLINNTEDEKIKPPEPKIRTQNPIVVDDKPIAAAPVSLFMPPIPAPRLSKRDSLTLTPHSPPIIPEFLRVQLHHIDKSQNKNVVLSKNLSIDSDKYDDMIDDIVSKNCDETNKDNFVEMKSLDEVEIKQDQIIVTPNVSSVPIITSIANKTCENVTKVTELKQKSVQSDQQPIPNPRYSVVSITTNSSISEQSKNKTENQIIRKKSVVKDVNGLITERIHNNAIISDKNNTTLSYDSKTNDDCSSVVKNILRKKSFNKDISFNDDKSTNIMTTSSSTKENIVQDPTECIEVTPKVILRQKSIKNDIIIVDAQQKSKKPSLDVSTCQPIVTKNTINDKSNEINVKEKYRNSFGSCDTLLSQDNTFQSEVVYRRKSLTSREVITKQNDKDDEPELLKVFARRSLKIKDTDINLSNVNDLEMNHESSSSCTKSRDSDKENECGDSPPEERKKIKDNFNEAKTAVDNSDNVKTNLLRTQRSISLNSDDNNTNVNVLNTIHKENNQNSYEKRQRSRTFPDNHNIIDPPNNAMVINQNQKKPPIDKKPSDNLFKDNEIDVITKQENLTSSNNEDNGIPLFKRIQQRKEEWEKRAQLAMKRTTP